MKKKIKIHIGTHKTGSTFIQNNLTSIGNDILRNDRIFYADKLNFYYGGFSKLEEVDEKLVAEIRLEIKQIFSNNPDVDTLVLSNEWFSGHYELGYNNSKYIATVFKEALTEYDVAICVFLRRQDEFVESMFTQLIHQGNSLSFEKYIASLPDDSFNWYDLVKSYEEQFGKENIQPFIYTNMVKEERFNVQKLFGEFIGSREFLNYDVPSKNPNTGFSFKAVEIGRRLNAYLSKGQAKSLRRFLQKNFPKQKHESYNYFSENGRLEFLKRYDQSNNLLFSSYGNILNASGFFEPNDHNFKKNEELTIDELFEMIGPWISENLVKDTIKKPSLFHKMLKKFN